MSESKAQGKSVDRYEDILLNPDISPASQTQRFLLCKQKDPIREKFSGAPAPIKEKLSPLRSPPERIGDLEPKDFVDLLKEARTKHEQETCFLPTTEIGLQLSPVRPRARALLTNFCKSVEAAAAEKRAGEAESKSELEKAMTLAEHQRKNEQCI